MAAKYLGRVSNSVDAKKLGEEGITFNEARALVRQFEEFNPFHILPEDRAHTYLEDNWGGRLLHTFHFGFRPRKKNPEGTRDSNEQRVQQSTSS